MGSITCFAQKPDSVRIRFINEIEPKNESTDLRFSSHYMDPVYGWMTTEVKADSTGTYVFPLAKEEKFAYIEMTTALKLSTGKYLLYRQIASAGDDVIITQKGREMIFSGKGYEKYEARYRLLGNTNLWFKYLGDSLNQLPPSAFIPNRRKDTVGYKRMADTWKQELQRADSKLGFHLKLLHQYRERLDPMHYELMKIELLASKTEELLSVANDYLKSAPAAATEKMKMDVKTFIEKEVRKHWTEAMANMNPAWRSYSIGLDRLLVSALENRKVFGLEDPFWILSSFDESQRDRALIHYYTKNNLRKKDDLLSLLLLDEWVKSSFAKEIVRQLKERSQDQTAIYRFSLTGTKGEGISLSSFKGKTIVIDFWFTGCAGCVMLAPHMEKIMESVEGRKDLVFLSVSIDKDREKWLNSVEGGYYSGPSAVQLFTEGLGSYHPLVKYFNVISYPRLIIVGKDGKLISENPPRPHDEASRQQFIDLLK